MASPEIDGGDHLLESGLLAAGKATTEEEETSGRKKSETSLVLPRPRVPGAVAHLQEVFLGTKLFLLFSAVPLAIAAESLRLGQLALLRFLRLRHRDEPYVVTAVRRWRTWFCVFVTFFTYLAKDLYLGYLSPSIHQKIARFPYTKHGLWYNQPPQSAW